MAAGRIIVPNYMPALDLNGNPLGGARITFYLDKTTTLATTYADEALTVPHPNPVIAGADGVFPTIFADITDYFTVAITDADGAPIGGLRNLDGVQAAESTNYKADLDGSNVEADAFRGAIGSFASRAAAMAHNFGAGNKPSAIRLDGYASAGDGGGALYKPVAAEPAHIGRFQSADGQWWELAERVIAPEMFGAPGGTASGSDRAAMQAAHDVAHTLGVAIELPRKTYDVGAGVTLKASMQAPRGAKIQGVGQVSVVGATGVSVKGVSFEGRTASGSISDVLIANFLFDDFSFDGGDLINGRVTFRNQLRVIRRGAVFRNFTVKADFSGFDYVNQQLDPLYFNGWQHVSVTDAKIVCTNTHRVFKFSDTEAVATEADGVGGATLVSEVSPYRSRYITLERLEITAITTSNKQVFDLYSGTTDFWMSDVVVNATGFSTVFENKTGRYSSDDTRLNTTLTNVTIVTDKRAINLEGAFGNTMGSPPGKYALGYQDVTYRNTKIIYVGDSAPYSGVAIVDHRFLHFVDADGLTIENRSGAALALQFMGLRLLGCQKQRLTRVRLERCKVYLGTSPNDQNSDLHTAQPELIEISDLSGGDYDAGSGQGLITLMNFVSPNCVVKIRDCAQVATNVRTAALGLVCAAGVTVNTLDVRGCVSRMNNVVDDRVLIQTLTATNYVNEGNSWNRIGSVSVAYDPPSLAAGASDTTQTVAVPGARALGGDPQRVSAAFNRNMGGAVIDAWVSGTDTVSYRARNPTAGVVDVQGGTLRLTVLADF
ncbi:hypothetical protein HNP32_003419 [Brevundimonas bullata]|uniref:Pectate lyase superfamily protein domain-containing protein n=1 Tax=Brevundimonas bullata TaxID=13160 RepID=A0A7W7ISD4_9CAUL|nr:hypothetical protein [Brevundimonas bullata]MBB4799659.1 hypothetical protein [Brevundimonas bullata]MBB6384719.1 hypothetical protein [Brevundimonas bullata]